MQIVRQYYNLNGRLAEPLLKLIHEEVNTYRLCACNHSHMYQKWY